MAGLVNDSEVQSQSNREERLPPLLSVIADMVDLIGFFTLGNIVTVHITGNLALASAAAVRGGPVNLAQILAIRVFIRAPGSSPRHRQA